MTYILYASVLIYSRTWLMPRRYCSFICGTQSFSSIFSTDLLLCRSNKPVKIKIKILTILGKIKFVGTTYQLLAEESTDDCFECAIHVDVLVHRFRVVSRAIDCHEVQATKKLKVFYYKSFTLSNCEITYNLQILQVANARWDELEFIVSQIDSSESFCKIPRRIRIQKHFWYEKNESFLSLHVPIIKKFPGNVPSFKLLYDKSSTSSNGNAPKPLGNELRRLIDKFKMRNFGNDEIETGSSSMLLLATLRISKLVRLAMPGGMAILWYFMGKSRFHWDFWEIGVFDSTYSWCDYDSEWCE